jgi:hypothetical protein
VKDVEKNNMNTDMEKNNSKKLDDLIIKYPLLFRNKNEMEPFNCFGFECNDGWFHILNSAFRLLYAKYNSTKHFLEYWKHSTNNKCDSLKREEQIELHQKELDEIAENMPMVAQIKEKFGTLRLYMDNCKPFDSGVIQMAEEMSAHICEVCGCAGETFTVGWHKTLCNKHAIEKYGQEKVSEYKEKVTQIKSQKW